MKNSTYIMCFILCFGISTGIFFETLMSDDIKLSMQQYLSLILQSLEMQAFSITTIAGGLFMNVAAILLICISSCSIACAPTSALIFFVKGMSLGYCCALILETLGASGVIAILVTILPQNLLLLPALLFGSNLALSTYSSKRKKAPGSKLSILEPEYLCVFLILTIIIAVSCFVQLALMPLASRFIM